MSDLENISTSAAPQDLWFLPAVVVLLLTAAAGVGCLVVRSNNPVPNPAPTTPAITARPPAVVQAVAAIQPRQTTPPAMDYFARPLPALHNPSILVDKSARVLSVFDNGQLVKQYRCITGSNTGDKVKSGDMKTPEGVFYVCVKNPKSKFTRSLGLSYPDAGDAARGLKAKWITRRQHNQIVDAIRTRRQPLWNTTLGGEIMIHGWRTDANNRVRSGTLGCIAIDDACILELFPQIKTGTQVTIRP